MYQEIKCVAHVFIEQLPTFQRAVNTVKTRSHPNYLLMESLNIASCFTSLSKFISS